MVPDSGRGPIFCIVAKNDPTSFRHGGRWLGGFQEGLVLGWEVILFILEAYGELTKMPRGGAGMPRGRGLLLIRGAVDSING